MAGPLTTLISLTTKGRERKFGVQEREQRTLTKGLFGVGRSEREPEGNSPYVHAGVVIHYLDPECGSRLTVVPEVRIGDTLGRWWG